MRRMTASVLAIALLAVAAPVRAQEAMMSHPVEPRAAVRQGTLLPGRWIAVRRHEAEIELLCAPDCELSVPPGSAIDVGWALPGRDIDWTTSLVVPEGGLRLDARIEDRSTLRNIAYAVLVVGAVLLGATAIVGIATEPEAPEMGWFGSYHSLVFAGIAGVIVLAFGVPGVGLALGFERDAPVIEALPED